MKFAESQLDKGIGVGPITNSANRWQGVAGVFCYERAQREIMDSAGSIKSKRS